VHTSRSTVSRLLQQARDSGIVEITVHYPWRRISELERELCQRFGLREAIVLDAEAMRYAEMLEGLGVLAAGYLESILTPEAVLGISWGTAIHSMVEAMQPGQKVPITVVQMIGAVGQGDPHIDGPDLARELASRYDGTYRYLHAPLIVDDAQTQERLLREPSSRETLALVQGADIAVVGLGALVPEVSSWLRAGYCDLEGLHELRARGAIGDICGQHCDINGRVLDMDLNDRVVGIDLETLQSVKYVMGVGGGEAKAEILLSALKGRHINVAVTDQSAARQVLSGHP
jgi:DNA-binding transcriptional regulator LsrR (DeoR family)